MAEFDLRQMPEDQFRQFVAGLQAPITNAPSAPPLPPSVTPEAAEGMAQVNQGLMAQFTPESIRDTEPGRRMGVREGAFLDISKGVDATTRWQMGLDENQLNQLKLLTEKFGPGNVDLSDDGRFIVRNQPAEGGGVEDVMVDPIGVDSGDAAQLAGQILPMAAGAVAGRFGMRLGGQSGIGKAVAGAATMAAGTEITGGIQDTFVRWMNENEVNFTDIAKHRAKLAVMDASLGLAAAGGAKVMSKATEGLLGVAQVPVGQTATTTAQKELFERTGVKYPLTPGQESEQRILLRLEATAGGRVGSAGALDRIKAAQQNADNELRRVFLGLPRTMSDDELMATLPRSDIVGQRALGQLGKESARVEQGVASATEDILRTGTAEAQQLAGVNLTSPLVSGQVGKTVRAKVVNDFNSFKSSMGERYEEFLSRPEIRARTVKGGDLASAASRIEADFVPKARKGAVTESLEAFVPAKFRGFLDELKGLKGKTVSINDLKRIRTSIDNSISEGISIPGTDVAQLESLREAVDGSIVSALKGMDPLPSAYKNTAPLTVWQNLKKDYATGMSRFDRQGIREMLITEGERGSIGDTALAESIIGDSGQAVDRFNAFKSFFGSNSPEFEALKQVAREKTLRGSLSEVNGYVDGAVLRTKLRNLRPEVSEELFGKNSEELHRIGEVLSRAQGKLDSDEIVRLAHSKSLTAQKVAALQEAEMARTKAYNNKLIRAAAKGALGEEKIQPSQFVRHATEMDPNQAAKVVSALSDSPETLQGIRQLAIEDLWGKIRAGSVGQERLSATALNDALGDKTHQETMRVILGSDTLASLQSLVKTLSSREVGVKEFSGNLGGQMDINRLFLRGEVGSLPEIGARMLVATLYAGPMKRVVTNLATANDRSRLINATIASTPFIEGLVDRFGSDGAFALMSTLREAVEPIQTKELFIQGDVQDFDPSQLSKDEFKAWLSNTVGTTNPRTIRQQVLTPQP